MFIADIMNPAKHYSCPDYLIMFRSTKSDPVGFRKRKFLGANSMALHKTS